MDCCDAYGFDGGGVVSSNEFGSVELLRCGRCCDGCGDAWGT